MRANLLINMFFENSSDKQQNASALIEQGLQPSTQNLLPYLSTNNRDNFNPSLCARPKIVHDYAEALFLRLPGVTPVTFLKAFLNATSD